MRELFIKLKKISHYTNTPKRESTDQKTKKKVYTHFTNTITHTHKENSIRKIHDCILDFVEIRKKTENK